MQENAEIPINEDIDSQNKKRLLEGYQISLLKNFLSAKNKSEIIFVGPVYYLFSKYWPTELAEELANQSIESEQKVEPSQLIEENKPLKYFASGEYDWNGIKKTISLLDEVRKTVIEKQKMTSSK